MVNSVSTSNITSSSITLTVNATAGSNPIQTYYYSNNNGSSYVSSTSNTYTFSGLSGNTTYNFRVYVVDNEGVQSNYGTTSATTTYANPVVNSVSAGSITESSIRLTINATAGSSSIATYYYSNNNGASYVSSTSNTYRFSGLSAGTTYNFRVYVVDTNGNKSNERTTSATTTYVNPSVSRVTVTNATNNSLTVSVIASGGTNSISRYYYSINNGSYTSSTNSSYTFSGLSAGQSYSIRVYVTDTSGRSSKVYSTSGTTDNTVLLADYIKGLYTSQGSNGLYYHTSSLANSAADNSYRYAGANPNNYVCFGSDASTCPAANLYRIIGVFGNEVKLIKNTSYRSYAWESDWQGQGNTWNSSTKPDIRTTLNSTFLSTLSSTWQNKIATHAFKVGGGSYNYLQNVTAATAYRNEVGTGQTGYADSMKIGLMYVSDYGFAASNNYWTTTLYNYDGGAQNSNWMYLGSYEWTISRYSDVSSDAFGVDSYGRVDDFIVGSSNAVRPSFYLTSSTTYVSGSGSLSDPIRIN